MSNRTRQNNKRADRKIESNGSPEIPDRRETSEELGRPLGPKRHTRLQGMFNGQVINGAMNMSW